MLMLLAAGAVATSVNCWAMAGDRYHLPPYLLYAVAQTESSFNPRAYAVANNGTYSVGLMQINSSWFPTLAKVGITEADLYDPCTSVMVGGWILSQGVQQYGPTWKAIGSYFAGPINPKAPQWVREQQLHNYQTYSTTVIKHWNEALASGGKLEAKPRLVRHHHEAAHEWVGAIATLEPNPTPTEPSTGASQ